MRNLYVLIFRVLNPTKKAPEGKITVAQIWPSPPTIKDGTISVPVDEKSYTFTIKKHTIRAKENLEVDFIYLNEYLDKQYKKIAEQMNLWIFVDETNLFQKIEKHFKNKEIKHGAYLEKETSIIHIYRHGEQISVFDMYTKTPMIRKPIKELELMTQERFRSQLKL